ncbi:biopolymer transporter ExbD [Candidatus Laterigemmans baculatus]|uniref:biopolymer transporter ExbD n=1 Tax=Candidatus Laterigemmans baculatus TaxID=2770505 RepID=UPI0013DA755E|nr:biopolymer transporter ExbD [Candidatus Laterigemmans baculatus]
MRLPHHAGRSQIELSLTPMIDVVFLLLVFFLWTSSFEQPEFDLPSAVAEPPAGLRDPSEAPPPPEAFDEIVILVRATEGQIALTMNGSEVPDVETLRGRLAEIVALGVQPPVIVDPEPQTPVGLAIDIYDVAREAGLDQVLFAANE